jgi:RNA polymerase sigma factor (sigma-70 family)
MMDDAELLRRYAESRSEEAFAELVRRRIGLVYSVALRHTRDAHRAEDVTQAVFTALARKAETLARRPVLVGWLYRSAQFAASDAVRAEARRQVRETEAQTMHDIEREAPEPDWNALRPVLDEVLDALDERDRDAVLLRYFDGQPFAGIGAKLRLSENAARMRVERALEKMHAALARRGVKSTAAALGAALAGQAGVAAPAGLAANVTGAALAGAVAGGGATAVITFMSIAKTGAAALAVVAGLAVIWQQRQANEELRDEVASLRAQLQRPAPGGRNVETKGQAMAVVAPERAVAPQSVPPATAAPALQAAPPATETMRLVSQFVNAGRATPRDTLETNHWATKHLDLATLAVSFEFDEEGKIRADTGFALLTEEMRRQFGSPENLAAAMMADRPGPSAIAVLEQIEQGPDDADLKIRALNSDGTSAVETVHFRRHEDGWRVVIPAASVNGAVNLITGDPNTILRPKPKLPEKAPGALRE